MTQEKNPLVSVIIPTYNRARKVQEAIESALQQTYTSIEIIVADDGSTDETEEVLKPYGNRIRYLKLPHGGQGYARSMGLQQAQGHYIANLDSDDLWESHFLETCMMHMMGREVDFVFANWKENDDAGNIIHREMECEILKLIDTDTGHVYLDAQQLRHYYLTGCSSPSSSFVIRRSSIPRCGWNSALRIGDDWCLLMDMIFTKNSTAIALKEELWLKRCDRTNLFEGRDRLEVTRDLGIHDTNLVYNRFRHLFTGEEKRRYRAYQAEIYLRFAYYQFKRSPFALSIFVSIYKSFILNKNCILSYLKRFNPLGKPAPQLEYE
jgi:glycosyltransferase involved in cell wall biosynthesis